MTKGADIMGLPALVTLLLYSHFRAQGESSKPKREDFVYRLALFLNHCYSTLPDMCPCVLLHVFSVCPTTCFLAPRGRVLSFHFWGDFAPISNEAPSNGPGCLWLAGSPPPIFPSALLFFVYFFSLISLVLPSFLGVLALLLPCSSQGFVQFSQGWSAGKND